MANKNKLLQQPELFKLVVWMVSIFGLSALVALVLIPALVPADIWPRYRTIMDCLMYVFCGTAVSLTTLVCQRVFKG